VRSDEESVRGIYKLKNRRPIDSNDLQLSRPGPSTGIAGTVVIVGVLCDYFTAPSDEAAAATIDWDGGPSRPDVQKRGLLRRGKGPQPLPTVDFGGVEPTVQMGTLDEILTGTPFEEVLADTTTAIIAERDGGERLVVRLSTRLQAALAATDAERLKDAAVPWAATDEFFGLGDPEELGDRLVELSALARTAERLGQRMYCWLCV
jgi:hypothetical protein